MVSRKHPLSAPILTSMRHDPSVGSRSAPGKNNDPSSPKAICSVGRRSTTSVAAPSALCARIVAPLFGPSAADLTQSFVPSRWLHSPWLAENGPALIKPEVASFRFVASTHWGPVGDWLGVGATRSLDVLHPAMARTRMTAARTTRFGFTTRSSTGSRPCAMSYMVQH
jgi:hypothetical protein